MLHAASSSVRACVALHSSAGSEELTSEDEDDVGRDHAANSVSLAPRDETIPESSASVKSSAAEHEDSEEIEPTHMVLYLNENTVSS